MFRLFVATFGLALAFSATGEPVDFNRDIRPILADRCFACHGPDEEARKADLRLDIEEAAKFFAISPGDPSDSELISRIFTEELDDRMPPVDSEIEPLSAEQKELLRRWIEEGAVWAEHWAFVPPTKPALPAVGDTAWTQNAIDHFILARLEDEGLTPSSPATREKLIRRVSFDLIGLPPTLEEIDAFVSDTSPNAYEKVVDRLLASPHYGERMAINWLDGARFADSNGYQNDFGRDMSPWRDWVIEAFNANMPYDQFTVEQIAGDLLPDATDSQRIATGFNRNNHSVTEGGSIEEEWLVENLVDRVDTTSTVFLALTMGCARCHDHKYDNITQREFYEFYAFFNSTEDKGFYEETRGNTGPVVEILTPEHEARLADFDAQIAEAKDDLLSFKEGIPQGFKPWVDALQDSPASQNASMPAIRVPLAGDLSTTWERSGVLQPAVFRGDGEPGWTEGLAGAAVVLDGKSYLELGKAASFARDASFSVTAWVRPDGGGALFSRMDDAADFQGVDTLITAEGRILVHLIHKWPDNAIKVLSDEILEPVIWSHVGVTYDGSGSAKGVSIFVNGRKVVANVDTDKLSGTVETSEPLRIGSRSASERLQGAVSDFRIYNAALSGADIAYVWRTTLYPTTMSRLSRAKRNLLEDHYQQTAKLEQAEKSRAIEALREHRREFDKTKPTVMVMKEREEPRPTYLLRRGVYDQPDTSEALDPGVPSLLPPMPEGVPNNRLGLARWLVDPANPLTARVAVNRLWEKFFGLGIVRSSANFGIQSEPPFHPELLDWLAVRFVELDWDLKAIQKEIVMSAAYRQDSATRAELLERDPENRLLARGPRFRLPAELIRDNALSVSGLLAPKIGGPSVMPYQPEGMWEELAGGASQGPYVRSEGKDLYRRSLYTNRKRTVAHATLSTFDAPNFEICQVRRARTNTPLQALALLNDTTYVEAARKLAERMLTESGGDPGERLEFGFRLVTGRYPTETEAGVLRSGLSGYLDTYRADAAAASELVSEGESPVAADVNDTELAAYTAVASVMLNLDEAVTKE